MNAEDKTEFSIDEYTGEVLQHDGFIRYVIAKSLYALVERLANTESELKNAKAENNKLEKLIAEYRQLVEKNDNQYADALSELDKYRKQTPSTDASPELKKGDKVQIVNVSDAYFSDIGTIIDIYKEENTPIYRVKFVADDEILPYERHELSYSVG